MIPEEIDCFCGNRAVKDQFPYRLVELNSPSSYTGVIKYICQTCGRIQLFSQSILESIYSDTKRSEK